jgi:hypothetical protein
MSTAEQRQEWARLAGAATPGVWTVEQHSGILHEGTPSTCAVLTTEEYDLASFGDSEQAMFDSAFIAASRAAVPALLADVERLTAERDALAAKHDALIVELCGVLGVSDALAAELAQVRAQLEAALEQVEEEKYNAWCYAMGEDI